MDEPLQEYIDLAVRTFERPSQEWRVMIGPDCEPKTAAFAFMSLVAYLGHALGVAAKDINIAPNLREVGKIIGEEALKAFRERPKGSLRVTDFGPKG